MTYHLAAIISKGQCSRCNYYGQLHLYEEAGTWGQVVACGSCASELFGQERKESNGTAKLHEARESE